MNSIGTGEFIKQISEETGYTQVQIKEILNAAGEQIKTNLQNTFNSTDDKPDEFNIDTLKTEKGYDLVKVRMTYSSDPEEILYYYYILNGDSLACITSYSFTLKDEKELVKQSDKLINSFDWIQK